MNQTRRESLQYGWPVGREQGVIWRARNGMPPSSPAGDNHGMGLRPVTAFARPCPAGDGDPRHFVKLVKQRGSLAGAIRRQTGAVTAKIVEALKDQHPEPDKEHSHRGRDHYPYQEVNPDHSMHH